MKILLVTSHLKVGGIAVYTVTLANYLSRRGHLVFVASGGGEFKAYLIPQVRYIEAALDTKSVLSKNILSVFFKLCGLIRKEGIEVIHAQTRVAQWAAWLLSIATRVPYTATWHGFYRPHLFRKLIPCWGDRTIAISRTVYDDLRDSFGRRESRIRLIFNGVDTEKFVNDYSSEEKKTIKKRYGLKEGPVIGIISRLSPEKGHKYLINAFKTVRERFPDVQLMIVGEGRLKDELKKMTSDMKLEDSVYFLENTLNTKELLAIMDVFTRPSIEEGFGLAVVEAMLMGLPIVSTDVGGFKSILNHGRVGILVAPENAVELGDALSMILKDKQFAEEMGKAGEKYARLNFSADRMAAEVEEVYKEIINEKKPSK